MMRSRGKDMQLPFDTKAPKKAANLSINSDLLRKAKQMKINLSAILEQALTDLLIQKARQQWFEDNKQALRQYNDFVDKNGVFSDGTRSF